MLGAFADGSVEATEEDRQAVEELQDCRFRRRAVLRCLNHRALSSTPTGSPLADPPTPACASRRHRSGPLACRTPTGSPSRSRAPGTALGGRERGSPPRRPTASSGPVWWRWRPGRGPERTGVRHYITQAPRYPGGFAPKAPLFGAGGDPAPKTRRSEAARVAHSYHLPLRTG